MKHLLPSKILEEKIFIKEAFLVGAVLGYGAHLGESVEHYLLRYEVAVRVDDVTLLLVDVAHVQVQTLFHRSSVRAEWATANTRCV